MVFVKRQRIPVQRMTLLISVLMGFALLPAAPLRAEEPDVSVQLGHNSGVCTVALSPDRQMVLSGSWDNTLKLWDMATGREIRTFRGHSSWISAAAFSPDGHAILSGSGDGTLKLWDIATGRETFTCRGHSYGVTCAAFSPDGQTILSGSADSTLKLWDAVSGREIRTFRGHANWVEAVAFSPDGRKVVSGSWDRTLKLWDAVSGREMGTFRGHEYGVTSVAFSPDGQTILSGSWDHTLKLWDAASGRELRTYSGHSNAVTCAVFSSEGKTILSGSWDNTLKLWDAATGQELRTFSGHSNAVLSAAWSADDRMILSGSGDHTAKLWDAATGRELRTFRGHSCRFADVAFSPDGRTVLSGSRDSTLKLWDVATGRWLRTFRGHANWVESVAYSPDGRKVLSGSWDNTLKLWDVATGREIRTFRGHTNVVIMVTFSHDGRTVLSGSADHTVKLWDVATGRELHTFSNHSDEVISVAFSPDDRTILSGSGDHTVKLWDAATGKELRTFRGHTNWVESVAFAPDGKTLVSGSGDSTLKLWETETGKELRTFRGHTGWIEGVAFSRDGQTILSCSGDRTVKLWETATGHEKRTFRGHSDWVEAVAFSPDERTIVSGSWDETIRLWNSKTGKEIVKMASFDNEEWVVITPEGYYNASLYGDQRLNVRVGNNVYGMDQYEAKFYKPEVVKAALSLLDSRKAMDDVLNCTTACATTADIPKFEAPFVVIKYPDDGSQLSKRDTVLSIYVEDRNLSIKSVQVFLNGRPITDSVRTGIRKGPSVAEGTSYPIPPGRKSLTLAVPINLDPDTNLVQVIASNEARSTSRPISVTLIAPKLSAPASVVSQSPCTKMIPVSEQRDLWIVAVGINHYEHAARLGLMQLHGAVSDARDIVRAYQEQEGKVYAKVHPVEITDSSRLKPTREAIVNALDSLKNEARPEDDVVLFLSGHGETDPETKRFWFLTSETDVRPAGGSDTNTEVSEDEINNALKLSARRFVYLDACRSGAVLKVDNDQLARLLNPSGILLLASCDSAEESQELGDGSHGVFTQILLQGFAGEAIGKNDCEISLFDMLDYVTKHVSQLTNRQQNPHYYLSGGVEQRPYSYLLALVNKPK